jgi:transcription elongation factor Elf1
MSDQSRPDPNSLAERWRQSQEDQGQARNNSMSEPKSPDELEVPSRCPACRSQDVKTTSKVASSDAYWRCEACGEVWNVARHRAGSRYAHDRPFRR